MEKGLDIRFDVGNVEAMPYADASFDVVSSAFGVNFARSHEAAAAELARVCRADGRLGLALMPPASRAADLWTLIRSYGRDSGDHPADWGDERRARELLAEWFELELEQRESPPEPPRGLDEEWDWMRTSFPPLRDLVERLPAAEENSVREEFAAIRAHHEDRPRSYVIVLGRRR